MRALRDCFVDVSSSDLDPTTESLQKVIYICHLQKAQLDEAVSEIETDEEGKFDFAAFCTVACKFIIEEDEEQVLKVFIDRCFKQNRKNCDRTI